MAPGFIADTAFHDTFTPPEAQQAMIAGIPLGRAGTVEDVAARGAFLASAEARGTSPAPPSTSTVASGPMIPVVPLG